MKTFVTKDGKTVTLPEIFQNERWMYRLVDEIIILRTARNYIDNAPQFPVCVFEAKEFDGIEEITAEQFNSTIVRNVSKMLNSTLV